MVKRFFIFMIICAVVSPILLTSCQKDLYDPTVTVVSPEPTDLDFSTSQKVKFDLTYDVPTGLVIDFDLYTENPCEANIAGEFYLKEDVKPIASGVSISGIFTNIKALPSYVKELYAYSYSPIVPSLMHATITNGTATFTVVNPIQNTARSIVSTRTVANNTFDHYLGQYGDKPDNDATGKPNYIDASKKVDIPSLVYQKISSTFPDGENGNLTVPANSPYLKDATLYIQEEAEIWVNILVSNGDFVNEFGYFCYDGTPDALATMTTAQKSELKLISAFNQAKIKDAKNQNRSLESGDYVKLQYYDKASDTYKDKFPANTTIGWALRPASSNAGINNIINNTYFYSCSPWNPESDVALKQHTIYFKAGTEADPFICFGFEDMKNDATWGGYFDRDCNDMMFNVQLSPITALDPPPTIEDPNDVTKNQRYVGYLGYEDYWPVYFDYDLNDLLVKYTSTVSTYTQVGGTNPDTNVYVTNIEDDYTMVFSGAGFHNKFGVKMPFNKNIVEKVIITDLQTLAKTEIAGSSLTADLDGFLFDICDDATAVIVPYDRNTAPYTYRVAIELKSKALKMTDFEANNWMAPYNPFVTPISIANGRTGTLEVHLPGYMPTQRVINVTTWFGYFDDRSDIAAGIYYIGGDKVSDANGDFIEKNIFPFAIHLSGAENFYIPTEHVRIDNTFPRYRSWAESGMTTDKDWYLDTPVVTP